MFDGQRLVELYLAVMSNTVLMFGLSATCMLHPR
jgi:hypothetical protein